MTARILSINQIADLTGVDRRTVKKRLQGIEPTEDCGKGGIFYDLRVVLPKVYASDEMQQGDSVSLEQARIRESIAKAEKTEIEVETMRKERTPIEGGIKILDQIVSEFLDELSLLPMPDSEKAAVKSRIRAKIDELECGI